jgi:hypothetical protein
MNNSTGNSLMYKLRGILYAGDSKYKIMLTRGAESIEVIGEVKRVDGQKIGEFNLLVFESDEFNNLCTRGYVNSKTLKEAVFAFHECI